MKKANLYTVLLVMPLLANASPSTGAAITEMPDWQMDMNQTQSQLLEQFSRRLSQGKVNPADVASLQNAAANKAAAGHAAPKIAEDFAFNQKHYQSSWQKLAEVWPRQNISCHTPELAAANMALLRAEYAHHQGRADVKQVSVAERMMESANTPCTTGETP